MLPLLPLAALGGLAVVAYVVTRPSTTGQTEPVMSAPMKQAFTSLLASSDPNAMEASASALEPFGFLTAAAQLRARATVLRNAKASGTQPPPPPQTQTGTGPGTPASQAQAQTGTGPGTPAALAAAAAAVQSGNAVELPDANGNFSSVTAAQVAAAAAAAQAAAAGGGAAPPIDILAAANAALAAKAGGGGAAALPSFATVTTNDPAPTGDLAIRSAPNAAVTDGVGAEKGGIVLVVKQDVLGDGVWSQVVWGGGSRLPPASGFVKSAFLRASSVGPLGTAIAGTEKKQVRCVAPSGCRLRKSPSTVSDFRAFVGNGEAVKVMNVVPGNKLEAFSPGKGGWAQVQYGKNNLEGWLPLEWLVKS